MSDSLTELLDEPTYLRRRAADERAAADATHCMARTAHEDLAEFLEERADAVESAGDLGPASDLLRQIDAADQDRSR